MNIFKFYVETGDQAGTEFALRHGDNLLGRSREAHIRLSSSDVSSLHARITVQDDEILISNISQYGTWVEARQLQGNESMPIKVGQLIRAGKNALRLREEVQPPFEKATPEQTVFPASKEVDEGESLTGASMTNAGADKTAFAQGNHPNTTGVSQEFDKLMRAKAEFADLEGSDEDSYEDKTHAQKTIFAPKEELERRLVEERKKGRHRLLLIVGASIALVTLLFLFLPKPVHEGKLEFDESYDIGETNAPMGGFMVLYPKNGSSRVQPTADGLVISSLLGRKQDVRLVITLQESINDRWATQDGVQCVQAWMKSHPDCIFGLPSGKFEGQGNGVWVWSVSYARKSPEAVVGESRLFFNGNRLEVVSAEVPEADQGRAENMFRGCTYFEFLPGFEETCWAGQSRAADVQTASVFGQIREDLRREAPLTWAAIAMQLRQVLSQSVDKKNAADLDQALQLLAGLRQQQSRWFNSQHLLLISAERTGNAKAVAEVAQRCQAVFSDPADNRYFEVRKW